MAEFYAEGGYELNRAVAAAAFSAVIGDRRLGYVWIIQSQGQDVGHVVFTLRYAMEYGGIIACLDDLYVKQPWRNQGYATAALKETQQFWLNIERQIADFVQEKRATRSRSNHAV